MNEPNQLESQLQSWTLRRPSPELRNKLFLGEVAPGRKPGGTLALNWLAPAAICAVTLLISLGGRSYSRAHSSDADTNLFFASISMNSVTSLNSGSSFRSNFPLTKVDMNLEQNVWRMATFASTNHDQSHSSMGSLPTGKTNILTP